MIVFIETLYNGQGFIRWWGGGGGGGGGAGEWGSKNLLITCSVAIIYLLFCGNEVIIVLCMMKPMVYNL